MESKTFVDINVDSSLAEDETKDIGDGCNENEECLMQKIHEPQLGMGFGSVDDLLEYYKKYGNEKGFPVKKRTSKKGNDGALRYVTVSCGREGKQKTQAKNASKMRSSKKVGCKAMVRAVVDNIGKVKISLINLDHNHELSPGNFRFYKTKRVIQSVTKSKVEINWAKKVEMNDRAMKSENERRGRMYDIFSKIVNLATVNEDKTNMVMEWGEELLKALKNREDICGSSEMIPYRGVTNVNSSGDGIVSKEDNFIQNKAKKAKMAKNAPRISEATCPPFDALQGSGS